MEETPRVAKLLIYPIKSLDGVEVETATVLKSGALQGDREFALMDERGQFVNGKRHAKIHAIRTVFDRATNVTTLTPDSAPPCSFQLETQQAEIAQWMSQYFGFPVQLHRNTEMGFPDDTLSPGPTIISTATLEAISAWFPGLTVEEVRRRFRSNIEISGVPAFWEDGLFAETDTPLSFQIGPVQLLGINPCQRCVVVTRNPWTGAADSGFQKTFVAHRQQALPNWAPRSRFNHFFRLAVNTQIPSSEAGKLIRAGDVITLTGSDSMTSPKIPGKSLVDPR